MIDLASKVVVVTGASSGIGLATARLFAQARARVVLCARRRDRLEDLQREFRKDGYAVEISVLDVSDRVKCREVVKNIEGQLGGIDVLINNAGKARGLRSVEEGEEDEWRDMVETNIMGLLWMTQATIPVMKAGGSGHIVNLGSVAGHETYSGGSVYAATKHGVRAITGALRQELLGTGIRVSSVDPGLVETEFSLVRFGGDAERAAGVYRGMKPLTPHDVAECILFVLTRPEHVNIDELIVKPISQATSGMVFREDADRSAP
jgi:3-hydroxy acid dehydrogenase/malonic semialdehyde reductase